MEPDPPPPPPADALMEELVEEVLLRFPPADPARLARAALVCRRWRRILTGAAFRRRFRDMHRARPPMLGYLCNAGPGCRFVPSPASFRPPRAEIIRGWRALDARHGRALLRGDRDPGACDLAVWDPLGDRRWRLPSLPWPSSLPHPYSWNAAVLCAAHAGGCDHLDCGGGRFLVVVVGTDRKEMFAHVYSSDAGAWGGRAAAQHPGDNVDFAPSALVGDALYFPFQTATRALRYSLGAGEMEVIDLPPPCSAWQRTALAAGVDGRLGFASADKSTIYLWSREVHLEPQGGAQWTQTRVIRLDTLLPAGAVSAFPDVLSFVDGIGVIFVRTADGLFTIDLKSSLVTQVSRDTGFSGIFPFMSFQTPALRLDSTGEGSSAGA